MTQTRHFFAKRVFAVLFAVLTAVSVLSGISAFAEEEQPTTPVKQIDVPLEDGVYYTEVDLWHATSDQPSMGNQALRGSESFAQKHPEDTYTKAIVVVENNKATALLEFMPMGFIGKYGFLLNLDGVKAEHLQQWGGIYEKTTVYTQGQMLTKHLTADGKTVYDPYNNPSSSEVFNGDPEKHKLPAGYGRPEDTILNISDKPYGHLIAVECTPIVKGDDPVPQNINEYTADHYGFVHVFVPVMYTIMPTSGDQHARLKVDWVNAEKAENPDGILEYQLWKASNIEKGCYTDASYTKLQDTINAIKDKLNKIWPTQNISMNGAGFMAQPILEQKDFTEQEKAAMAKEINDAVKALEKEPADYSEIEKLLADTPADLTVYTDDTAAAFKAAKDAIVEGKFVDEQELVNGYAAELKKALANLKLKDEYKLDKNKLADGVYSINLDMFKMNRKDLSMSNNAIGHTAKLVVKDGEYTLFVNFRGIHYLNKFGYLGKLSYYKDGYTLDSFGNITGEKIPAEIITVQKDYKGVEIVDEFNKEGGIFAGNKYPETIAVKVVRNALADPDGFLPAHVFVPVMESIAPDNGDQDVYMKLDWATVKATTDDDPAFVPEKPEIPSPEFNAEDENTGVKVHGDKGVFKEDTKLVVAPVTSGEAFDAAKAALEEITEKFNIFAVDFKNGEGAAVAPNGNVSISFKLPEGSKEEDFALYRINEDGTATKVNGTVENGYLTVVQRNAANYALADLRVEEVPQTGDSAQVIAWSMIAMIAAGIGYAVIGKKRKAD